MLNIKNLQYKHGDEKDIYTYNLNVNKQEIIAIIGQSGSGKSTLLDIVSGFLEPISGNILLNDKDIVSQSIEKRAVTILFQHSNLFEHLSVQKNILLGVNKVIRDSKDDVDRVKEILKEVGLEQFEHTVVTKLSGGQQQRVALARVLIRREPILLLDEPFTGLDIDIRFEMLDLVKDITIKYDLHTIMITHDIEDAKSIATKIYKMHNNKLLEQ